MKKFPQMDVIFILKFNETPLIQKKKNELNNRTQVKYHHLNLVNLLF